MSDTPRYLAVEFAPDCIRWGAGFRDRQVIRTIPLPEAVWQRIPAKDRMKSLAADALAYIRDTEGIALPSVCIFAVPYLTCRELAQIESEARSMGVTEPRVLKRISALAFEVNMSGLAACRDEHVLLVDWNGASCETAVVQMWEGMAEMVSVVQRQITAEAPMDPELLRRDACKAIDRCSARQLAAIYVSDALPSEYREMLETCFRLPCTRTAPDGVLRGCMLQGGVLTGLVRNALLLDATDFAVCAGQEVLIGDGESIPNRGTKEISYRTARPDHCLDIYLKKNNMVLDRPLHLKLSVASLLEPGADEQKLAVSASIDAPGCFTVTVRAPQTGREVHYGWDEIRGMLLEAF